MRALLKSAMVTEYNVAQRLATHLDSRSAQRLVWDRFRRSVRGPRVPTTPTGSPCTDDLIGTFVLVLRTYVISISDEASHQINDALAAPKGGAERLAATVDDACGSDPTLMCEWMFDVTGHEWVAKLTEVPLTVLIIMIVAWVLSFVARRALDRVVRRVVATDRQAAIRQLRKLGVETPVRFDRVDDPLIVARRESRAASISAVLGSTVKMAIWSIAIIVVIGEFGVNLAPIIAGAGIVGVALGFGAQSLVRDCIAGLFMLMEDQYGIGDIVDLGEAVGTVEEIGLRATVLRAVDGTVWHVPNGEVKRVGNTSQLWSTAIVDVDVAYDSDLTTVRNLLAATARALCESDEWRDDILDEPQVLGVEALGADGITVRVVVKTAPGIQYALQRALREAFKVALDGAAVEIPFPQRTLWLRNEQT